MDCCTEQGINTQFGEALARKEVQEYTRSGLNSHSRAMVELVSERGMEGTSLLEIGSGIGAVTLELLKRGATKAINVEASSSYRNAAQKLAERAGFGDKVVYHRADFTHQADQVVPADIVVMHRVVCCYPDAPTLLEAAAEHSEHLLALSYPVDIWYMRLYTHAQNLVRRLKGSTFRTYVHPEQVIFDTVSAQGMKLVEQSASGVWQLILFERDSTERRTG